MLSKAMNIRNNSSLKMCNRHWDTKKMYDEIYNNVLTLKKFTLIMKI